MEAPAEWLYNSGKLKVTHKVRLKFSVGNYEDTMVRDVLPMDACHVLLGWPWQFDRRSNHEGRSNIYSLWHKGKRHVLQPMLDKDIKVEVLVAPKQSQHITTKPRIAAYAFRVTLYRVMAAALYRSDLLFLS
jgi:hypothetical protein